MNDVINSHVDAIKAVVPAATFKEIWTYDRGRVDVLPGVTMAWTGAKRVDDYGIRTERHRHEWYHTYTVRLWFRTDTSDSANNDRDMRAGIEVFIDAFEADPTLGGKVNGSGIIKIDPPSQFQNTGGKIVGQGVDITVVIKAFGAWQ